MSKVELIAKSISRMTFLKCSGNPSSAKTTRGIMAGKRYLKYSQTEHELINVSTDEYFNDTGNHIYISEGIGDIGVYEVKEAVEQHIKITGSRPVVMIDYLQILTPVDMRASDKQNTDKAVFELKRLSRSMKIPVIGISSFNRENYSSEVNMSSYKESGAIEYSSDVLLGLQLVGAGKKDFDVNAEKKKDPRQIELKILKNRNGASGDSIMYNYYPMFNYFKETGRKIIGDTSKTTGKRI
jgi:replicative DNA helicase